MNPQIVDKLEFTVVGILLNTSPMSPEIPSLWDQFGLLRDEVQHSEEPDVCYGVIGHFNHDGRFDYLAGKKATVADLPGMTAWNVPANTYAVFSTTLPTIGATYSYIYNTWLPASEYQMLNDPILERYDEAFNTTSTLTIWVPIVAAQRNKELKAF